MKLTDNERNALWLLAAKEQMPPYNRVLPADKHAEAQQAQLAPRPRQLVYLRLIERKLARWGEPGTGIFLTAEGRKVIGL